MTCDDCAVLRQENNELRRRLEPPTIQLDSGKRTVTFTITSAIDEGAYARGIAELIANLKAHRDSPPTGP